jgi:uncharacterized Rmd1/YagE family protein
MPDNITHDNSEVATKKALTDMIARHNKLSQQEDMLIELMKTVNDLRAKIDSMYKEKYKNP